MSRSDKVNKSTDLRPIKSQRELAKLLGDRDVGQVNRWLKHDERWPFARKAPWPREDVPKMLRWVADIVEEFVGTTIDEESADELITLRKEKLRQEIRRLRTLADADEMDTGEKQRRLIPADEVKAMGSRAFTTFRNRLLGAGAAIAPLLEGRDTAERQTLIDQHHSDVLNQLETDLHGMG